MTPEQYKELNDRLNYLEDMLKEIRDKLNSPDYNISLTIPKPVDCVGKCTSEGVSVVTSSPTVVNPTNSIPWE